VATIGSIFDHPLRDGLVDDHRSRYPAGMHGVNADILLGQRGCVISHQTNDAMFGGVITGITMTSHAELRAHTSQAGSRARDDDRTALAVFQQSGQCRLDRLVNPIEQNVHRVDVCLNLITLFAESGQYPSIGGYEVRPSRLGDASSDGGR
jgi:hypothetical protein